MDKEDKKIEIVDGDGSELNISPIYKHLNIAKPKTKDNKDKKVIIPDEKKK